MLLENKTDKRYSITIKKDNLIGRGRKECPKCQSIVGSKLFQCDCGYSFSKRRKNKNRQKGFRDIKRYLFKKIERKNYRDHRVEHHRATTDSSKIKTILTYIHEIGHEYKIDLNSVFYDMIIKSINNHMGHVTANSFRKNILVDLHKMGYISRIGKNEEELISKGRNPACSMILLDRGIRMIKTEDLLEREQIHANASIDLLERDYVNFILYLIDELKTISVKEFMYFVSGEESLKTIIKNIEKYRNLTGIERDKIDELIDSKTSKINHKAKSKNHKRDFIGLKNEVIQICGILRNIPGISFNKELLGK